MSLLLGTPFLMVLAGLLGLAIGSFLNVVVYRVPAGVSVLHPPSACPRCETPIRSRDNIPVLGWLLLRGKCRDCAAPISARYPLVEALTGAMFVAVTAAVTDSIWVLAATLAVAAGGIALALIDLDCGRLPFSITAAVAALGGAALGAGWIFEAAHGEPVWPQVAAVALGAGIWFAVYATIWFATLGRGMGLGDVALAPVLGGVLGSLGLAASVAGLALGFLVGCLAGVVVLHRARSRSGRHAEDTCAPYAADPDAPDPDASGAGGKGTTMVFGPPMIVGALAAVFIGDALAQGYLRAVGLN